MGRMSAAHELTGVFTPGSSVVPASRNGGASNAAVNGTSIDLTGKRGVYFTVESGAITGTGNYLAYVQTADTAHQGDLANATWTNVNATTYPNAAVTVKTNASSVFEMSYDPTAGGYTGCRAVLVVDANIVLSAISHVIY